MTTTLDDFLADVAQSAYGWPASLQWTYDKTRELIADGVKGDLSRVRDRCRCSWRDV